MEHSILDITSGLLQGFGKNCVIFFVTLVLAVPLGLVISFGSMSKFKPLAIITKLYVWIIRGTPLMLQLFVVFFVPGLIFDMPMRNRMVAALIAFVINYSAYFSEIYRGGIEGIPRGQREAGQVLGMTKSQIFFKVELLQVIKRIIPPMGNEIITLIKDTSLANVIAVMDITMTAKTFTNQGLIWPLFYSGLFYLAFCGILTLLFSWLEKKLNFFKN